MRQDYPKRKCPRLQKVMWLLVVIAVASMVVTLHISHSLTWRRSRSDVKRNQLIGARLHLEELQHLTLQRAINDDVKASHMTQADGHKVARELYVKSGFSQTGILLAQDMKALLATNFKSRGFNQGEVVSMATTGREVWLQDIIPTASESTSEVLEYGNEADGIHQKLDPHIGGKINKNIANVTKIGFRNDHITHSIYSTGTKGHHSGHIQEKERSNKSRPYETVNIQNTEVVAASTKLQTEQLAGESSTNTNYSALEALYDRLTQIEKTSQVVPSVIVQGSLTSVKHHLPLIEAAFHKFKAKVTYEPGDNTSSPVTEGNNRCVIMCLNNTYKEDNCVISLEPSVHRKVNVIPELMSVIMSPRLLCAETEEKPHVKSKGQWYGGKLPCYSQDSEHVAKEDNCDAVGGWWMVARNSSGNSRQYIPCGSGILTPGNLNHRSGEIIFIPLPKNNLLSVASPGALVWQTEVLVTSLLPPRVYLHSAGIAWNSLLDFIHRKHQRNVSLLDLHQLISEWDSDITASLRLKRLASVIMDVIRLVERHITTAKDKQRFCPQCFQLLEVVLVFDSSFEPLVLEVIPSHFSEHLGSLSDYLLEQNVLEDLAAMLVSRETISTEILRALSDLGVTHIRDKTVCDEQNDVCLGGQELSYLLDTRREQRASRNWIRLFPSSASSCTHIHSSSPRGGDTKYGLSQKPVGLLEKFALSLEEYFLCPLQMRDKMEKLKVSEGVPVCRELGGTSNSCGGKLANISEFLMKTCDNDNSSLPYLNNIHTYPYIQLFPEFSPLNTEYHSYIDYNTTVVQIQGVPRHCGTQAKLEDKHRSGRWGSISLGLGKNMVHVLVVGMDHLEPYILNIYKLIIYRRRSGLNVAQVDPLKAYFQTCSLKQDCSLPLSPSMSCGLQPVSYVLNWQEYTRHRLTLPPCKTGSLSGEWMVPCTDCHNEPSCLWNEAVWQPAGCHEAKVGPDKLKDCFAGKKILFIGDSTNRGILHYILERLNGSLQQWDKTHYIRIYPDLNHGQTVFGFAYYPQFWLMPGERPMLDKALFQLLNRTAELSGKDIVIVLGGVHWLARHHLDLLVEVLWREGLNNTKVIVKGLGAGFHQPVSDVHQLSLEEQKRLSSQNHAVLLYARRLGFSIVDTFSMTMARYKDFLQGKCACHFHQVSEVKSQGASKLSWNVSTLHDDGIKYHVEGDINAAYSEMVINRICALHGR